MVRQSLTPNPCPLTPIDLKRILITGANGLLGQNLVCTLGGKYKLLLTDLHEKSVSDISNHLYVKADIIDSSDVRKLYQTEKPDIVIHAAAMTDVDGCEEKPEKAYAVNVQGTANLVKNIPVGVRFLFVSTDYVFDGNSGPYSENDTLNPASVYGKTKAEAEKIIMSRGADYIIARTIVLYGTGINLRPFFTDWVLSKLETGENFKVVTDQTGNTTLASNLAENLGVLAEKALPGVYHIAGSEIMSRYNFSLAIAECFGYDKGLISACKTSEIHQKAPRPLKSGFVLDKVGKIPGVKLLDVKQQLEQYKKEKT